jgi:hypothetical protein
MKPGSAGGGKGPDFWCARKDGDVRVIGLWSANTCNGRNCPNELCREAKILEPAAQAPRVTDTVSWASL